MRPTSKRVFLAAGLAAAVALAVAAAPPDSLPARPRSSGEPAPATPAVPVAQETPAAPDVAGPDSVEIPPGSTFKGLDVNADLDLLHPKRISARRLLARSLKQALRREDYDEAALFNAILAQEALQRAERTLRAWEKMRDPETGLVPVSTQEGYWNGHDTASDAFPFFLLASHYVDPKGLPIWVETIAKEREISGPLPRTIFLQPTKLQPEGLDARIFAGAEYAKDGLLAISERLGRGPWFDRMEEIARAIIERSRVDTSAGKIPAGDTEVNGDMLQVLSRLTWATGNGSYLDMAERIAEAYLFEVIPKNGGLPTTFWNFQEGKPPDTRLRLRDHGNEIIPGLVELYVLEKAKGRPQADRYREPLKNLLDLVLEVGRTDEGLWYDVVDTQSREVVSPGIVDNWGYILNAYLAFDIAEGTGLYSRAIERAMKGAADLQSYAWERNRIRLHDGHADTIESMLYFLPWFDLPMCRAWVDDEMEILLSMQLESGFVAGTYLDGNFVRTTLMYARYKTQGTLAVPWRRDLRLGAARDNRTDTLHVYLGTEGAWQGRLIFDLPRHRTIWNMTLDYPRLNSAPEWFVVEPEGIYEIVDLDSNRTTQSNGQSLAEGWPVSLKKGQRLRLAVSRVDRDPTAAAAPIEPPKDEGETTAFLRSAFPESIRFDLLKSDLFLELTKHPFALREQILAADPGPLRAPIVTD